MAYPSYVTLPQAVLEAQVDIVDRADCPATPVSTKGQFTSRLHRDLAMVNTQQDEEVDGELTYMGSGVFTGTVTRKYRSYPIGGTPPAWTITNISVTVSISCATGVWTPWKYWILFPPFCSGNHDTGVLCSGYQSGRQAESSSCGCSGYSMAQYSDSWSHGSDECGPPDTLMLRDTLSQSFVVGA